MHTGTRATGDGGKDARLTPYTKAKPQRRKRAKDELDYVRRKVVDIEETLSSLNQVGSPKAFSASDEDKDVFFRWKQVAERQKEEANKAVVENLKLRAMLEGQLTIAKRLEAVMGEYQQQVASDAFTWHPNQTRRGIERDDTNEATRPTPSDDVIFSDLNGSLEEQYRQTVITMRVSFEPCSVIRDSSSERSAAERRSVYHAAMDDISTVSSAGAGGRIEPPTVLPLKMIREGRTKLLQPLQTRRFAVGRVQRTDSRNCKWIPTAASRNNSTRRRILRHWQRLRIQTPQNPEWVPQPHSFDTAKHTRSMKDMLQDAVADNRAYAYVSTNANRRKEFEWHDSRLVRAATTGRTLIVDEAEKAALEGVCILKGLTQDDKMLLRHGKRLLDPKKETMEEWLDSNDVIHLHPDFWMSVLANRPGFPFLGNNLFRESGDIFSSQCVRAVHESESSCSLVSCFPTLSAIENPDEASALSLLTAYAPNVLLDTLHRLCRAFEELREFVENGTTTYPYSTRKAGAVATRITN
ncbi:hypothetical protein PsorP6_011398 [Peronosclerospora sorghi]|uniref:Uncharacterized protein n=1 Tax=Peronosclerospora sorghi TaxID=230839 RepID=A0ACC0WJS6_9STRA|nr:hypothetical protein PsorP6_011398 [Peronosclerospora sorghi]